MFIIKEILWFCNKKCGVNKDIKKINGPEGRGFQPTADRSGAGRVQFKRQNLSQAYRPGSE
jgi:hypothetical protein